MLVTVAAFFRPFEAYLFRSRLEAEGITAFIGNEQYVNARWPFAIAFGGVTVQVLSDTLTDAREILVRCETGSYESDLRETFGDIDDHCPNCNSVKFRSRKSMLDLLILLVSFVAIGIAYPLRASVHRCAVCHARWVY